MLRIRIRTFAHAIVLAAAGATAAGCSAAAPEETDADIQSAQAALEREDGGLSRANEAPGFGDPSVQETAPLSDQGADEEETLRQSVAADARGRIYRIALLWGHMPAADESATPPAPTAADFSGSVSVDRGAIGVSRTLRFDGRDRLEPRTQLREVSFVSHTQPHVDGLLLTVRVPESAAPVLHYKTATVTTDIDLSKLEGEVGGIVRAADGVNGLSYLGFEDKPGCASGFLFGKWKRLAKGIGKFHGRVVGDHGAPLGHVKGIYGHAKKADRDVFFGKYIDPSGAFRGLFGGTYDEARVRGVWGTIEPRNTGGLSGFISDGYVADDGRGVFVSRFREKCQ